MMDVDTVARTNAGATPEYVRLIAEVISCRTKEQRLWLQHVLADALERELGHLVEYARALEQTKTKAVA